MRRNWSPGFAALFVLAFLVPFIGFAINGSMPMVNDSRGLAGAEFVAGGLAYAAFGRSAFGEGTPAAGTAVLAVITAGTGIATLVLESGSWVAIAPFAAGLIVMWGIAILHDLRHPGATAIRR